MNTQNAPLCNDLAALIGSRICHDLISPIGAINNGLELLVMSGTEKGPELDLIGESVGSASARIRFFRIAFGAAGDQMVGHGEVAAILRDLYGGTRTKVLWTLDRPEQRDLVRLSFLAMQCLETAMPYGGQITVSADREGWRVHGTADRISKAVDVWSLLAARQPKEPLQPAHVQFALLPLAAREAGRKLRSRLEDAEAEIRF